MSDEEKYTPIDCGVYSEYELAIMHKRRMRLHWQDEAGTDHVESVIPKDLKTEDKSEYLIAEQQDGSSLKVRLDHIKKAAVAEA